MSAWTLSWRLLVRNLRSGKLWLMWAGLVLAAASLASVSLFAHRLEAALDRSAGEWLAADAVIESRQRPDPSHAERAVEMGLVTTTTASLSTVVYTPERSLLFQIKAVGRDYPLRGRVRIADDADGPDRSVASGPSPGRIWVDSEGLRRLGAAPGEGLQIGRVEPEVEAVLRSDPDAGDGPIQFAPGLIMAMEDLEPAGLLGPGARVRWKLLVAGPRERVEAYVEQTRMRLAPGERLRTAQDAESRTGQALAQARRFLAASALVAVLLAAVAIWQSAWRFAGSQQDSVALLKVFGADGGLIARALAGLLLWLVLGALIAGALLGYAAQAWIAALVSGQSGPSLPPADPGALWAVAPGMLLLAAGFALPPLLALHRVPPMRVLRADPGRSAPRIRLWGLIALGAGLGLAVVQIGDLQLGMLVLGGALAAVAVLALAAWALLWSAARLADGARGVARLALAGLARRRWQAVLQISALGLGLTALLTLAVVRSELVAQWQASVPDQAPDHFLVNIQREQLELLRTGLEAVGVAQLQIRPITNAQLIAINDQAPPADRFTGQVNLSWAETLPPANTVIAGRFFSAGARGELSVARRWAERVGVGLGDRLNFDVGGRVLETRITSIRSVDWDSFNVNFFLLLTPEDGRALPHQYVASFRLPDGAGAALDRLLRQLPNVSLIDVGALLERVLEVIDRISRIAEWVFGFVLAAGLLVLLAVIESTRDHRRTEVALLRALGAGDSMIRGSVLIEYGAMALVAALVAVCAAAVIGGLMATWVFGFGYRPSIALLATALGVSVPLVVGAGWLGHRRILRTPPMRLLRAG
ncbi:MAG: FtsX-like permease family protein [Wenzhouxiangellaceae bacterium]